MTDEQKDEIILTVKNAFAANSGWADEDAYVIDCNDVDHIAQETADNLNKVGYRKIDGDNYVSREWHDEQVLHLKSELERLKSEKANVERNCAVITKDELKEYQRQAVSEFVELVNAALKVKAISIKKVYGVAETVGLSAAKTTINTLLEAYKK